MTQLFLVAHVGGRAVAIDSAQVVSVVDINAIVPVPRGVPEIRGLAALRSRVVTVIDSCVALGVDNGADRASRAVITLVDGHHYAFLVDSLDDVAPFIMAPLASGVVLDRGWRRAGRGVVERGGEPILVIDLGALVPAGAIAA